MNKVINRYLLGFALLLPITITALAMPESVMKHPALPNISLHDMSGHLVKLKSLEGKIMVVTVWANWCPYCHQEAPGFVRLHKEMGSRVRFIGIAIDDRESAEHFVSQEHVNYPTLLAGAHPGKVLARLGDRQEMLPYTLIISPKGYVLQRHLGFYSSEKLSSELKYAMNSTQ